MISSQTLISCQNILVTDCGKWSRPTSRNFLLLVGYIYLGTWCCFELLSNLLAGNKYWQLNGKINCMCSSKPRRRRPTNPLQSGKNVKVQFLELDSPKMASESRQNGFLENDNGKFSGNACHNIFIYLYI